MASSSKEQVKVRVRKIAPDKVQAEKVVIVTGPTFGSAFSFMLFGAVVGASAVFYWQSKKGPSLPAASDEDAVYAGLTAGGAKDSGKAQELVGRLNSLSSRVKSLAGKAKEAAQSAAVTAGPILTDAVIQARSASQEAQSKLQADLEKTPEPPTEP